MPNTLKASQSNVICGLGSFIHTTLSSSMYCVKLRCTELPTSVISITISQSGSASASVTSTTPTVDQSHIDLQTIFNCAAGDVITVALTSAAQYDAQLNTVKTVVSLNPGTT